jgi:hypothetical protein
MGAAAFHERGRLPSNPPPRDNGGDMSLLFRPSAGRGRALQRKAAGGLLVWGVGALLVGLCGPALPCLAADPPDDASYRDLRHTILARNALLKDRALAPLNLGVRVHNRVATLWGPVPSAELMDRAGRVLRKVPELLDVKNELHVEPQDAPPPQYLPERLEAAPPTPTTLPGFIPGDEGWRPTVGRGPGDLRAFASPAESIRIRPALAGVPDRIGDEAVLPAIRVPRPDSPPGAATAAAPSALEVAVARLRAGDDRFQRLRADVLGGQVRLSGTVARWEDVHELLGMLRRLPGVERVVIDQIRTASGP